MAPFPDTLVKVQALYWGADARLLSVIMQVVSKGPQPRKLSSLRSCPGVDCISQRKWSQFRHPEQGSTASLICTKTLYCQPRRYSVSFLLDTSYNYNSIRSLFHAHHPLNGKFHQVRDHIYSSSVLLIQPWCLPQGLIDSEHGIGICCTNAQRDKKKKKKPTNGIKKRRPCRRRGCLGAFPAIDEGNQELKHWPHHTPRPYLP